VPRSIRVCRIALVVITLAAAAHADPTPADRAMAEALFRDAKELRDAGKMGEACPKFAESHRLDPKPGSILNLATCYEQEGKTASAWVAYAESATMAARVKQHERERFARGKIDELEKKLSYLKLDVAPANTNVDGFTIAIDGKPVSAAAAGTRIPLDPGEHAVEAYAPARRSWSDRVLVAAGPAEKTIAVPDLAALSLPDAPVLGPSADVGSAGSTQRTLGFVALGIGAAGVVVGGISGVMTISEKNTVDEHCSGSFCNAQGLEANEAAKDAATVSTIAFSAAAIAVVTGVVLVLTAPRARSAAWQPAAGGLARVW
jgi:hypothetical protein